MLPFVANPARLLFILASIFLIVLVGLLSLFPIYSNDIFFNIAIGEYLFATGSLPDVDPFIFPFKDVKLDVVPYEWASHLLFTALFLDFNFQGLIFFKALIFMVLASIPFLLAYRQQYFSPFIHLLFLIALFPIHVRFILRASMFTELFLVLVLSIILWLRDRPHNEGPLLLPLVFLVWTQFHPGYPLGLFLVASLLGFLLIEACREKNFHKKKHELKKWGTATAFSTLACAVQPSGFKALIFPFTKVFDPEATIYKKYLYENTPLYASDLVTSSITWGFLALGLLSILMWVFYQTKLKDKYRYRHLDIFWILVFIVFAASGIRYVSISSWVLVLLTIQMLISYDRLTAPHISKRGPALSKIGLAFFCLLFLGLGFKVYFQGYSLVTHHRDPQSIWEEPIFIKRQPIRAVLLLDQLGTEQLRLYNSYGMGSFLAWYWGGDPKIFQHGFHYNPSLFARYIDFQLTNEKVESLIEEYNLNAFLLRNIHRKKTELPVLYRYLLNQPDWELVLRDHASLLFLRHSFWSDKIPVKKE